TSDVISNVGELMQGSSPEKTKYLARLIADLNSAQLTKLQEEYTNQTGGHKLLDDLKAAQANGNLSQQSYDFIAQAISLPNDQRNPDQQLQLARLALQNPDSDLRLSLFHLAMAGDSPRSAESRQKFLAENGQDAINSAFPADDSGRTKAMQIARDGRI